MSFFYYIALTTVSLGIAIFNLSIKSEGTNLTCYKVNTMSQDAYNSYKTNGGVEPTGPNAPKVVESVQNGLTVYLVPVLSSNIYNIFSTLIAVGYLIIVFSSAILCIILMWLSDMVPDDFLNMGWLKRAAAVFTKVFPLFIILIHWIILILIIAFWAVILTGGCKVSQPAALTIGFNPLQYDKDCTTLQIVNSIIFFVLHYVFAVLKDMIYIEPFMYSPQVGEQVEWRKWMFQNLGP